MFVKQCDFTGVSNSLRAMTPVTNLEATECPGYNDQATVLQSTILPLANPITNPEPLVQTFLRAGSGTSCFMSRNAVDVTNRRLRYEPDRWWIHVGASGESASIPERPLTSLSSVASPYAARFQAFGLGAAPRARV